MKRQCRLAPTILQLFAERRRKSRSGKWRDIAATAYLSGVAFRNNAGNTRGVAGTAQPRSKNNEIARHLRGRDNLSVARYLLFADQRDRSARRAENLANKSIDIHLRPFDGIYLY